jgi:hypothetical protein
MLDEAHRVPRERLRADERLADLEVFRQPQSSNPSFVTAEQLAAVEDHVRWPRAAVGLQRAIASGHRAEP